MMTRLNKQIQKKLHIGRYWAILILTLIVVISMLSSCKGSTSQYENVGASPDFVLLKDGHKVALFYGFVPDQDACMDVAEIFNKETGRRAYWCEQAK